ncbi:conserved hypothetical protein [Magnetospirillum sp. LM-5]|nr:conserved hypothetical protein [Magnetospirillum sp. LM-5]
MAETLMISGIGYGQGLVSRPVGVLDAAASAGLRRFNQGVSGLSGTSSQAPVGLNLGEGRLALSAAVGGADTVITELTNLKDTVEKARGLSVPSYRGDTNVFALQAEADQTAANIDQAVDLSSAGGTNLIGTPTTNVRISSPNGTIAVTVQPLTARELGVSQLDLTTESGIEAALSTVQAALTTATSRRELLAAVSDELGNSQRFTARLASSLNELSRSATGTYLKTGASLDIRA